MLQRHPLELFNNIIKRFKDKHRMPVPNKTLWRWWKHCELHAECPVESNKTLESLKRIRSKFNLTHIVTGELILCLESIIDEHPEYYLDEIQIYLCIRLNIYVSLSTLYRTLRENRGYSLKACYENAKQRSEIQRSLHNASLKSIVRDPHQLFLFMKSIKMKQHQE